MAKSNKQLYKGKCTRCGGPVTVSSPNKQTECFKCRGWKSKKVSVDKPKDEKSNETSEPRELNVLQKILRAMKLKEKITVKNDEIAGV